MKKRTRIVLAILASGVAVGAYAAVRVVLPPPAPLIDAHREYNALVGQVVSGQDASDLYWRAYALFDPARQDLAKSAMRSRVAYELRLSEVAVSLLHGEWVDPLHTEARELFDAHRVAAEALMEAYAAGSVRMLVNDANISSEPQHRVPLMEWTDRYTPEVSDLVSLGRALLAVRLREHEAARDDEGFLATVRTLLECSRRPPETLTASSMSRTRLGQRATLWLVRDAALRGMDAQTSEALIAIINEDAFIDADADLFCLEGERLIIHDWVWRLRHTMNRYEFDNASYRVDASVGAPSGVKRGSDNVIAAEIDRYFDAWRAVILSGDRDHAARPALADFPRTAPWLAESHRKIGNVIDDHTLLPTELAGTIVALRLAAYHDRHARWPDTLEQAMSAQESREPVTGDPFVYAPVVDPGEGRTPIIEPPASLRAPIETLLANARGSRRQQIFEIWRDNFLNPRPQLTRDYFPWLPEAGPFPN